VLKKLFNFLIVALIFVVLLQFGCETRVSSEGDFDHIIVFSDSSLYLNIESGLDNVFDHFVHTPHAERSFYHKWVSLKLMDSYKKRRNVILIGLLDQDDPVSEYVKKMLSPELLERVENGEAFEIFKEEIFAFDQIGLILCAANKEQLLSNLSIQSESIFKRFEDYHFKRINRILYSSEEQQDIEEFFAKEYGWTIRVPYAFQVVERSRDSNFVWIKRQDPGRSVFVFRTKTDKSKITEEWIRTVRDSLANVYLDGDSVSIEDTYTLQTEYNGIPAMKMVGIWQNHEIIVGGPFRTYVFYEEKSDYIYFIDIHVIAPGKRKKPFLDQLEVIARTFEIASNEK
jgi:uncharacterized protein DUF4837